MTEADSGSLKNDPGGILRFDNPHHRSSYTYYCKLLPPFLQIHATRSDRYKIDFDKVLVMDKGAIAEFASPAELLRNHKSKFYLVSPLHTRPPILFFLKISPLLSKFCCRNRVECSSIYLNRLADLFTSCVKLQVGPSSKLLERWRLKRKRVGPRVRDFVLS